LSYRNKTYVAFASEDIVYYRLMTAWNKNVNIDFDFYNAHDLYEARDTSKPETIRRNLRERMKNAKQVVLLASPTAKKKAGNGASFLSYELEIAMELGLPIVVAHLDGSRQGNSANYPTMLSEASYHTISVSYQPAIIKHALDNYAVGFNPSSTIGERVYNASVYKAIGL
jgi:hypothetical protein